MKYYSFKLNNQDKNNTNLYLGYEAKEEFLKINPIIVLKAFFIITILMISQLFNNFLISQITFKKPYEIIDSLNDLIKLKVTLMFPTIFHEMIKSENSQLDNLFMNSLNNIYSYIDFFTDDKFINDLCHGRNALFTYKDPMRIKLIQMDAQINYPVEIRLLDEFSTQNYITILMNRHLDQNLRSALNNRYIISN